MANIAADMPNQDVSPPPYIFPTFYLDIDFMKHRFHLNALLPPLSNQSLPQRRFSPGLVSNPSHQTKACVQFAMSSRRERRYWILAAAAVHTHSSLKVETRMGLFRTVNAMLYGEDGDTVCYDM